MNEQCIVLEYLSEGRWTPAGGPFHSEHNAWISLGNDSANYRTKDLRTNEVLTSKEVV